MFADYPNVGIVFLSIMLATNLFTGFLYWGAKRWKLLPAIRTRDLHTERKPRVGGVAMWLVAVVAMIIIATGNQTGLLQFPEGVLMGVYGGLLVVLLFGLLDDLFGLSAGWQLLGQVVAGSSLVLGGLQVESLRIPFFGQFAVDPFWSGLFVIAWIVIMINAINLFDGLDGLAGSISLTASAFLFVVCLKLGFVGAATLCLIIAGITGGFLPWNWHPSKIFMGTVGSQTLGFLLGTVAVISGAKVATAVLVLGIPLFDAASVILRRLRARQSPFKADQRHLHHRLLRIGLTPMQVVLLTNALAFIFGVLALSTQQANEKAVLIFLLVISMIGFIALTYFFELRAKVKRGAIKE